MTLYLLDGPVMPYAWGSRSALANLLGRPPTGEPQAELWMGAHPGGPARLRSPPTDDCTDLAALVRADPEGQLGADVARRYGGLPFLLKVLAIERPLSLQAHPSLAMARAGFAREEEAGIALTDSTRNYKDENHKPELLVALTELEVLCGFRSPEECLRVLVAFGLGEASGPLGPLFARFARAPDRAGLERFFRGLLVVPEAGLRSVIAAAVGTAQASAGRWRATGAAWGEDLERARAWLKQVALAYPADPGTIALLLLQLVRLAPGEGIFLPPRRLHAYLSGVGIELMASSDNVLRGGLTPKHVDVEELCSVLDFSYAQPILVPAQQSELGGANKKKSWTVPVDEFALTSFELDASAQGCEVALPRPSVLLLLSGDVELKDGTQRVRLGQGAQAFCSVASSTGESGALLATGCGRLICASVGGELASKPT